MLVFEEIIFVSVNLGYHISHRGAIHVQVVRFLENNSNKFKLNVIQSHIQIIHHTTKRLQIQTSLCIRCKFTIKQKQFK